MRTRTVVPLVAAALLTGTTAGAVVTGSPAAAGTHRHVLPARYHWRVVWHQVGDCGPRNAGQPKLVIWQGDGDMQSVLGCPDGTWWPS